MYCEFPSIFSTTFAFSALEATSKKLSSSLLHHSPPPLVHSHHTYAAFFHACARRSYLPQGQALHRHMLLHNPKSDFNLFMTNHVVNVYVKCGSLDFAHQLFDEMLERNIVSWTALVYGYAQHGRPDGCLGSLGHVNLARPMEFAFGRVISACGGDDDYRRQSVYKAWSVYEAMGFRNLVSWNFMIAGFQVYGCENRALELFSQMHFEIEVATALVKAYSRLGGEVSDCYRIFLELDGHQDVVSWTAIIAVFAERDPEEASSSFDSSFDSSHVLKVGFEEDTVLANALIHACARCGSIALSKQAFDKMGSHDIVYWNSMLKAYAMHGQACSYAGMVEEGTKIFETMSNNHGIAPQPDHYTCMVDILGRAGRISEVKELIVKMLMEPDPVVWSALLGGCRKHGETKLAKLAAVKVKELDPNNSLGYILMSNIFCTDGHFNEARLISREMEGKTVRKEPGLSWIEVVNLLHEFVSRGQQHPEREAICARHE
ncbi:Pentatricopeptide repeat-containing protein [Vitis vinifera]|uniref:Pentatricopeptide repeat-containing protein n=1 Tax=Vitis vinifera TaxID=29760 RepID=A0A438FJF0_VITVI|nr:Pentatricopeptide repeat-containing protein [Vitis vinifera]